MSRSNWTPLTDARAKLGAGAQGIPTGPAVRAAKNATRPARAVRLRYLPKWAKVIAEESWSQHENKAKALRRLRQLLFLRLREVVLVGLPPDAGSADPA